MTNEHPFAPYVAALGRGPNKSRALDSDEAEAAMAMVLDGAVTREQLGAFLMLLRYKGETAAELAGFVRAARAHLRLPAQRSRVDLDWPSYADKHKQLPWFVLSALLLAETGVRVLMHGIAGIAGSQAPTRTALRALGVPICSSLAEASAALARGNLAYAALEGFAPELDRLFALRPLLGLRSPVNSLTRALNPLSAPCQIQGVFHPPFRGLHQEAARLLQQPAAAVFKGGGGEAQRNPDKPIVVSAVRGDALDDSTWPALTPQSQHAWRPETLDVGQIVELWRGRRDDPAPTAAVTGTAAIALQLLGRADDMDAAQAMAEAMWRKRSRRVAADALRPSAALASA
jgi:anthranilate phosphoribosyltransferase